MFHLYADGDKDVKCWYEKGFWFGNGVVCLCLYRVAKVWKVEVPLFPPVQRYITTFP
jgi:hypothetical protein